MITQIATATVSAIFASGPLATLPTMTVPVIMVGATVIGPGPAMAQANAPFGDPMKLNDNPPAARDAVTPRIAPLPAPLAATAEPVFAAPVAAPMTAQVAPAPPPPTAPMPQAAPAVAPMASTWRVEVADMNVRRVIERWSRTAGMQVIYDASKDVDVGAAAAFSGTYEHALQQLFAAIETSEMPLRACLYANAVTRVIPRMQRCD